MNPYHVLEVPSGASLAEIRVSYRRLVRLHHPDCAPDAATRSAASERMVKINWAWHILGDDARRAAFDARLRLEQIEAARRQQAALRAQARGQAARGQQAHLADVLKAQAARRQQQNRETQQEATPAPTPEQRELERQFLQWQASERARQERLARAQAEMRPLLKRRTREDKKRETLARARLRRMRHEDKKRSAAPSARRQLAEAARLFAQEARASEAIAICHDVLRVDARNVPARELLGDFYLQLGRQDRALPLWEQALALQPDNSSVRRKLNSLRPHQSKPYHPHPRIPRATPGRTRFAPAQNAAPVGFWGRLRAVFRSGS